MAETDCNSKTDTTYFDSDTSPESARDSLNSLLQNSEENGGCSKSCLDVDVNCSLTDQCPVSCEDNSKLERRRYFCCNSVFQSVWGVMLIVISIGGFIFTPQDFMLWEKLNMRPGFPPFDWWADPPDEVRLRVYVFNVTNHDRFLLGLDEKLHVKEIGPVVYLEKLLHYNIHFNENSTLTYTARRYPIYLPDENYINLNDTLIVPNLAVLGIASYLYDANFMARGAFRLLVKTHGSKMFVKKTIYEYLWEFKDPVLDTSQTVAPGLVPVNNMGMLARIYADFTDEITVKIGPQWGHQNFFHIDRFRGKPFLPGYDIDKCPDRIYGSTEGVMYSQHLSKQDVLLYVRKTVCKLMPLYFDTEMTVDDIPVYRYNLSENVYERVHNGTDCYDTVPSLPPGLSDGSKCYFDFPMVVSFPHFYTGGVPTDLYVTGLTPDRFKHNSFVVVEPLTGTPFHSVARMQSNLRVNDLSGFSEEYQKYSNLVVPLFWAEYSQESLPLKIKNTIYFTVVILPPLSNVALTIMLSIGCFFIFRQIYIHNLRNDSLNTALKFKSMNLNNTLGENKLFYEKEGFLPSKVDVSA